MNSSRGGSAELLQRLGFETDDRVVVVHADDLGFSQASVAACRELLGGGLVSSAAGDGALPVVSRSRLLVPRRPDSGHRATHHFDQRVATLPLAPGLSPRARQQSRRQPRLSASRGKVTFGRL